MTRRMLASSIAMAMGLSSLVAAGTAHAIPSTLTVQGYLTNNAGVASDGNYTITVSLWNAETAGTRLFTQTITGVQVSGGLFDVALGNDVLYPGLGPDIFKNNNNVYVQVQLEAGPGVVANEAPLPRQALAVSPFAYASHYATSAASATTANTATTATTSNGLVCSTGCVSIAELDFDPATQAELDAALVNLVTTSGLNTTLADYAKKSELSSYVTSTSLNTTLGGYVTSNSLNTTLGGYVTTASLATQLGSYVTSATLGTTLGNYATTAALANYVTSASLATTLADYAKKTDLADYAKKSELPTSVNNLAGGTITSNTTVSGELAATTLKQSGKAVCDESGNCGATLTSLTPCTDGQVASFVGGTWKCADAAAGGTPPSSCTGNFKALQWNGTAWVCTDIRSTGLSAGKANGYEVLDDWGWAWDGTQRGAKTYNEAKTLCEGLGARLPLVTELWRNNATSGTGNLGDVGATSYLWTQVPNGAGADFYLVRLSDGATSNATDNTSAKYSFRCVWPDYSSTVFDGDNCNGAPGAACVPYGTVWNVDAADRAPMWYNSAQYECNFNNGSLLEPYQFHDLSQTGTWGNGTANWLWAADVVDWYQSYHGFILYQFTGTGRVNWLSDDNDLAGNYSGRNEVSYSQNYGGQYRFRCIGRKATNIGKAPANPGCNGGCYTLAKAGRRIYLDKTSRDALNHAQATETCRVVGAALPKMNEFSEAVHAGWTDNDNSYLWIDEPVYYYQGRSYYPIAGRWNTAGADAGAKQGWRWSPEGNTNSRRYTLQTQGEDNLFKFRCVWRDTVETNFTNCGANQIQTWDGSAYTCSNATTGTSNGQAIP
ncbi:MAG: hypothetical protein JNJ59_04525, partial [Deltaproteobacteria bacterium]|nr:hypothetical protein [Deltaproteobacteria bacterium]